MEAVKPRQIDSTLSVDDILYLQNIFLTSGLHHIKVPDVVSGRLIVSRLLQSMQYHHEVSCLTNIGKPPLKKTVLNIYNSLMRHCGQDASYDEIEEFFLEQYFADFMWVEISGDLWEIPLVRYALQAMHDLEIAYQMPIVALSYQ